MIVVDARVIVYLLTENPQRVLARQVRERDADWLVPPLWRHELLNVLATLARKEVLDGSAAFTVWRNAPTLLGSREQQPDMEQTLSLAMERGISAYDAQCVALAIARGVRLVSEDRKLRRLLSEQALSMADFVASLPNGNADALVGGVKLIGSWPPSRHASAGETASASGFARCAALAPQRRSVAPAARIALLGGDPAAPPWALERPAMPSDVGASLPTDACYSEISDGSAKCSSLAF